MYYAQLDESNVCNGVSELAGKVDAPGMIEINSFDETLLGKRYNAKTKEFEEVKEPEDE